MEEGIAGEVGATLQVVGVAAPRHGFSAIRYLPSAIHLQRIQSDADRHLLFERLQVTLKARFAHQLLRRMYEFFRQLYHHRCKGTKYFIFVIHYPKIFYIFATISPRDASNG